MLERFTIDTFAPLVGQAFRLHVEGAAPILTADDQDGFGPEQIVVRRNGGTPTTDSGNENGD
jgi:hypothetical protein